MLSVLYPIFDGSSAFGPDDVLGEAAYCGPFESDHSTISQVRRERPTVLIFHVPFAAEDERATPAIRALWKQEWTSDDVLCAAGGQVALADFFDQLAEYADWVRHRREHGLYWFEATPWSAAGAILSYRPDETVPDPPLEALVRGRDCLHCLPGAGFECVPGVDFDIAALDYRNGFAGALSILAIGGVDGMPARRRLWDA